MMKSSTLFESEPLSPYIHLAATRHHSCDRCSQAFPIFCHSFTSVYYTECKLKNKKWGRPGNETTSKLISEIVEFAGGGGQASKYPLPSLPSCSGPCLLGLLFFSLYVEVFELNHSLEEGMIAIHHMIILALKISPKYNSF